MKVRRVKPQPLSMFIRGGVEYVLAESPVVPSTARRGEEDFVNDLYARRESRRQSRASLITSRVVMGVVGLTSLYVFVRGVLELNIGGWYTSATPWKVSVSLPIVIIIGGVMWRLFASRERATVRRSPLRDTALPTNEPSVVRITPGSVLAFRLQPLLGAPADRVRWFAQIFAAYAVAVAAIVLGEGLIAGNWAVVGHPLMFVVWFGGLVLVYQLVRHIRIARATGHVSVELDADSVVPGQRLTVRVVVVNGPYFDSVSLRVQCRVKSHETSDQRIDILNEQELWSEPDVGTHVGPLTVTTTYYLPDNARPSDEHDNNTQLMWIFVVTTNNKAGTNRSIFPFTVV